jgi:hypothetical protein
VAPYASDREYIEDEPRWIELRTQRIHAEMRTDAETADDWIEEAEPGAQSLLPLAERRRLGLECRHPVQLVACVGSSKSGTVPAGVPA